nr:MAG TPA: hypothetical protein [Caudoviricetes sp.]
MPANFKAIDWTVTQQCVVCFRNMRPARARVADWPGTRPYAGHGKCSICTERERKQLHRGERPKNPGRYPTVAELAAAGHPCIEPCPKPSNKRSDIW